MTQADRYAKLAALTGRADNLDSSYHAAFYLLSYDQDVYEVTRRYVTHDGIGFTGLKRATRGFDERTREVIDIAHNLFSWDSKCSVTPFDISRLGYPYLELACNAIAIAADEVQPVMQREPSGQMKMVLDDTRYQQTQRTYRQLEQFQNTLVKEMEQDEADEFER